MGIFHLMDLIKSKAPTAIQQIPLSQFSNKVVACDAPMAMYQFLTSTLFIKKGFFGVQHMKAKDGSNTA